MHIALSVVEDQVLPPGRGVKNSKLNIVLDIKGPNERLPKSKILRSIIDDFIVVCLPMYVLGRK